MSLIRVLRTAAATLTRTFYVDETPTNTTAPPTVTVTRPDGTVVNSGTSIWSGSLGVYVYTLPGGPSAPGSATWQVDWLTATWSATLAGSAITMVDRIEVVGGFIFGLAEARASDPVLSDPLRYPTALLADKRVEVEAECERICQWAFVPRFGRAVLAGDGTNSLTLPARQVRLLRSIYTRVQPDGVSTAVSPLTNVAVSSDGVVVRYDGGIFPAGTSNVIVEYEHGWDYPPEDLREAAMYRLRSRLNLTRSGVPDRVASYTTSQGETYRVTLPGRWMTGIPEVDAVYQAYSAPPLGFA